MDWIVTVCLCLIGARGTFQVSTRESDHYVAAVVEFSAERVGDNGAATFRANVDSYLEYIKLASENDADIVVFPEDGLTGTGIGLLSSMEEVSSILPSATENYVPCTQNTIKVHEEVKRLSCAARDNHVYVVVNMAERSPQCGKEHCTRKETIYYNTNVVFDRTGKLIAKYHKVNLFDEPSFSRPRVPESVTFDTDFGVKFGTFICFDILFHTPPLNLTREQGVTDIVVSTAWFSELPFLTAIQTQFGWSFAEDVNLLVAGLNNPKLGNTGSGIYLGRKGIGAATLEQSRKREMLIYRVPKVRKSNGERGAGQLLAVKGTPVGNSGEEDSAGVDGLKLLHDDLSVLRTVNVNESMSGNICYDEYCCQYDIAMRHVDPTVRYKFGVFRGQRMFGRSFLGGVTICGVIQCLNETIGSCGTAKSTENAFTRLEITTKFDDYNGNLIFPSTLNSSLLPVTAITFDKHTHDDHVHAIMALIGPAKNLATFAVYSRDFTEDAWSAGTRSEFSNILLPLLLVPVLNIIWRLL